MSNRIGKLLVLLNLVICLFCLSWGAGVFLQKVDWGWKEPRKDLDVRLPSEIDKRIAALHEAYLVLDRALPGMKPGKDQSPVEFGKAKLQGALVQAQDSLYQAEVRFGRNHLIYKQELERLDGDPKNLKPIQPKEIKFTQGKLELDTPEVGLPAFGDPLAGIDKPYRGYAEDLKKVRGNIDDTLANLKKLLAREKELDWQLAGVRDEKDPGKAIKPGLYDLLEKEKKYLDQMLFEISYLKPKWVEALNKAEVYLDRRQDLLETLRWYETKAPKK